MANLNAVNATLQLSDGATLPYESWGEHGARPIVILGPANVDPGPLRALAAKLAGDYLVELVPLPGDRRGGDWTAAALDEAGPDALVIGYGQSCRAAFVSTRLRKVGALALVDANLPHPESDIPGVPTLILRGRQAERLTHEDAVTLMNRLPGSRLYELEDCGDDPAVEAPDALETAIRWFVKHPPDQGPVEFEV
ncbi:MAG: alpha/beta hydrolase [Chloroflexi bacterium]|nr:alpha/beta hydrolase [Chloroflexota bacterium]